MRTLPAPLRIIATALAGIAGVLLLVIIAITVADVAGRSLAGTSILGAVDTTSLLLVAVAFLGLAAAEIEGRHVSVDLVEMHMNPKVRIAFAVFRAVLTLGIGLLLVYGLTEVLSSALERGEATNGVLRLPTWPAKLVLLFSFVYYVIVAVWTAVNEVRDMLDGKFEESHTLNQTLAHADDHHMVDHSIGEDDQ